jgi:FkbM family methyltransferase
MTDGNLVLLRNSLEAQIYDGRHKGFECDITNDVVYLHFCHTRIITMHGGISNGDIEGIFVDKIYQWLPIKNKTVVDIVANIGDSAIYFALFGATKIICIEPFPKNYELAKKNIRLNNFSKNISIIQAGCSDKRNKITIDPEYQSSGSSVLKDFNSGINLPIMSLENILDEYNITSDVSTVLKMDCEGCEYETIHSARKNILQKFSHIMIEYHYGYKNLKEKLEECGFVVSVTRSKIYSWSPDKLHQKNYYVEGHLFAKRV